MQVLQVKEYNRRQEAKWHDACDKHRFNTQADFYTMPQIVFYLFYTNSGQERQTGYVAFKDHSAIWRKTKKEAIQAFKK